jgi:CRISPR-associated exonuclease Cas4
MESYIPISYLNDFIFCPRSIYYHQVHGSLGQGMYHAKEQTLGVISHESIEEESYSTRKDVLMNLEIYSEKYNLVGKLDIFDNKAKKLIERKHKIQKIYDGYVFQVYAQYFALVEMGYEVEEIVIRDKSQNKNYPIPLPSQDEIMFQKFENLINDINEFDLSNPNFTPNIEKCKKCIYSHICDYSLC